jgi:hypothetical protein
VQPLQSVPALRPVPAGDRRIWRIRATLADRPGSLATLTSKLAALGVNILAIQIHPDEHGVTDELLVGAPRDVTSKEMWAAVEAGGGSCVRVVYADAHQLADPPTRALLLAARVAADPLALSGALAELLAGATLSPRPADATLPGLDGRPLHLKRTGLPFTPTELSRARAFLDLTAQLTDAR